MSPALSVVIPAYNEEENVVKCLTDVSSVLKKLKVPHEIIFVNDGSKDRTGQVAKSFSKKIPNLKIIENRPNRGYGGSLKAGFEQAKNEFIVFVPADNQFDFSEVARLLEIQKETGADIVSGIRVKSQDPWYRSLNRWGWNTVVRALFGYLATDIDCGFKLFRRSILEKIKLTSNGAMVDTELFAGARARGMKIAEVPVTHLPRVAGKPTGANVKVIVKAFKDLFAFWWRLKQEIMVEQGRAVFQWEALLLLAVVSIAAATRLYDIGNYMTFLGDEGRDALAVREIVTGKHFPLIGPGTSVGSMYLGPWYYYLIAPSLLVSGFSPVGLAVEVALIGVATVALLWWISRQWLGRIPAVAISLLYALSPTVIVYSRSSWNPNIMPFFALLSVYGIWKVWRLGYWRWLVISAVSFAFVLNSHYLGLLLAPFLGFYWLIARKNKTAWKATFLAALSFLLLMSPLVFFDMRHNWSNSRALIQFFSDRQTTVNLKVYKAVPNIFPVWEDVTAALLGGQDKEIGYYMALVLMAAAPILVISFRKDKSLPELLFVILWIVSGLVGLGLYKQHIYYHYYGFLFPAPFLLVGFLLKALSYPKFMRIAGGGIVVLLLGVSIMNSPLRFPPNNQMARTQEIARFINNESGNAPFNLALVSKSNYDAAYRYFLELEKAPYYTIHEKLSDQLFVICEIPDCQPIGHPLWEIASFGWAKIDKEWEFPWGVKLYRLVHNPEGK